jgi:hypothetical protein
LQALLHARAVAAPRIGAEQKIVGDGHIAEQLAAFGHQAKAALDALLDIDAPQIDAIIDHRPRERSRPAAAASSVVLPAPFGPMTVTIWPGCIASATPRTASTLP